MKLQIRLLAVITFLATVSTPLQLNWTAPFSTSQVLAQTRYARNAEAERMLEQGGKQVDGGQAEAALKSFQQALIIYRELQDRLQIGITLEFLGRTYFTLGDYNKAIDYSQQSLSIARESQNLLLEGMALNSLGTAYQFLGDFARAIEYYQQSLAIEQQIRNRSLRVNTLSNLGATYNFLGDFARAIDYHQQALTLAREMQNRWGERQALVNLGITYRHIGDYDKAIEYYQQALTLARAMQNPREKAAVLANLGNAHYSLKDYTKAMDYLHEALNIAREVKDRQIEVGVMVNLASAYNKLGDYGKAIEYLQQSLTIAREIKNRMAEGVILGNIGIIYGEQGNYGKTIEYSKQCLTIAREIKYRKGEGYALTNLGEALLRSGNLAEAEKVLGTAIQALEPLRKGLNDANKVSIFETLAYPYPILQYSLVAQNKTKPALEISERGRARAFVELLASRLSNKPNNQLTIKPPNIRQIQQIAKLQNATLVQYSIIDDTFKIQGKEQVRESELFVWVVKPTGEVAFRRVNLKPLWQKQNTTLKELAPNSPSVAPVAPNSPKIVQTTPILGQKVIMPWIHPGALALLLLSSTSPLAIAIWYKRSRLSTKSRWLFPSLLLVCATTSTGGLIFLMTRTTAIAQSPHSRDGSLFAQLVDDTRESIESSDRGLGFVFKGQKSKGSDRLKQLHEILIKPINDLLPKEPNAHVIFIPQSSLFLVPFPALQDADGKYLIEKHTILTAPSIQVLQLTRQQKQRVGAIHKSPLQGKDALIVGNPTMPKVAPVIGEAEQQLPSLPGAEEEANAIASMLGTQAITGYAATKPAILQKISSARIIHLATHGLFDDIRGLDSAIALAPSNNDNGLLTAEQILDLNLNAELVVLSACDTGRGKITGDGVVGLSRSLISAGVPSVVVSLWSVPDAPTADLMSEFYRNLQKNTDKAAALRGAMLTTMKQHHDPRDWAAFTLIGESH